MKRIIRFLGHLRNKVPQWWEISKYEYQLQAVWATDDIREHRIGIEEIKEATKRISKRVPNIKEIKTNRVKNI